MDKEWVSVNGKKPKEYSDVLLTDGFNIAMGYYIGQNCWKLFEHKIDKIFHATHWRRLPKLPNQNRRRT